MILVWNRGKTFSFKKRTSIVTCPPRFQTFLRPFKRGDFQSSGLGYYLLLAKDVLVDFCTPGSIICDTMSEAMFCFWTWINAIRVRGIFFLQPIHFKINLLNFCRLEVLHLLKNFPHVAWHDINLVRDEYLHDCFKVFFFKICIKRLQKVYQALMENNPIND